MTDLKASATINETETNKVLSDTQNKEPFLCPDAFYRLFNARRPDGNNTHMLTICVEETCITFYCDRN
jgi:hypothetical protein